MIDPITDDSFAALLKCKPMRRASDSMMFQPKVIYFSRFGTGAFSSAVGFWSSNDDLLLQIPSCVVWQSSDLKLSHSILYLLSPHFCFFHSSKP